MKEVLSSDKLLSGCMIGRVVNDNPWIMGRIDREFYGVQNPDISRKEIILVFFYFFTIQKYADYVEKETCTRFCPRVLINPILNLFTEEADGKIFSDFLAVSEREGKYKKDVKRLIEDAVQKYSEHNPTALNKIHD